MIGKTTRFCNISCVLIFRAKTVRFATTTLNRTTRNITRIASLALKGGWTVKQMIEVIIAEMGRGNFSFLILVVGVAQLIVMWRKK